ncbi:hypothetical protein V8G54_012649 [Vigna mungo]|uniref:Uncharacterized protein n=1 Tax=Vigna mungo TaxID=3915 RepID=A0AAQ3NV50_VIGMU
MVAPIAVSSPKSTLLQNPIYLGDSSSSFFGGSLKGLCLHQKPRPQRRDFSNLAVASASATPSVTKSNSGCEGLYMAIRTRAGIRLQQCFHKHKNDCYQTQIWGLMGSCSHSTN